MKTEKLLIVFDWDGVVFDSMPMRKIRAKVLKKLGYSEDRIKETSQKVVQTKSGYSFHDHAKLITKGNPHDPEEVAKMIYAAVDKHPSTFVFPDARQTISELKRAKIHFDILTAGHVEFQEYKIIRSGLHSLFRKVHIVQSGSRVPQVKLAVLKKLAREYGQVLFLDDRADTIETVAKARVAKGKVLPVLVWRKKEKPPKGMAVVRRLNWKEIQKIAIHNGFRP